MKKVLNSLLMIALFLLTAAGIAGFGGSANAQNCALEICKSAPGAGDTPFTINFNGEGKPVAVALFDGGDCFTESFDFDTTLDATESPTTGWALQDVVCDPQPGITIADIPDGVSGQCHTQASVTVTCTFVNRATVSNIPTLSEWGMISAAAGLDACRSVLRGETTARK